MLALPSDASDSEEEDEVYEGESDDTKNDNGTAGIGQGDAELDGASDPERDLDKAGWGSSRKDYYDVDNIETEADALEEEEEALRLQKKQLQKMSEADFGFDETDWLDSGNADAINDDDEDRVVEEILPQVEITEDMPVEERNRILATRYPEFDGLAKEFLTLQDQYEQSRLDAMAAQKLLECHGSTNGFSNMKPGAITRWTALSTYLSALSMYFAILTSGTSNSNGKVVPKAPSEMRNHPIMLALVRSRTMWEKVKDLPDGMEVLLKEKPPSNTLPEISLASPEVLPKATPKVKSEKKKKRTRKSDAQIQAEEALAKAEAQRAERARKNDAEFAKISRKASRNLAGAASNPPSEAQIAQRQDEIDNVIYDGVPPKSTADQSRRKKTLQFYTSQIAQKANKRSNAGRDAGGDMDIPYRERLKDRQARLNAQAEARGRKKGEALGQTEEEEEEGGGEENRTVGGEEEDYYATIASRTAAKKANRAARKEVAKEAALHGARIVQGDRMTDDGRRQVTYQIDKNKGIDAKTKKNLIPRLKRRRKYEGALKRIKSIKPVYKGSTGPYGGETTGIKSGIIRSTKL